MDSETQCGHPILNNCELLKTVMWEIVDNNLNNNLIKTMTKTEKQIYMNLLKIKKHECHHFEH